MEGTNQVEPNEEMGRELKVDELKERVVYVLLKACHRSAVTLWYAGTFWGMHRFIAAEINVNFLLKAVDGKLFDDTGTQVHVYEYLGVV